MCDIEARDQLFNELSELPPPLFGRLLFNLKVRRNLIAGPNVPQSERTNGLLEWAENEAAGGCGLDEVRRALDLVIRSLRNRTQNRVGLTENNSLLEKSENGFKIWSICDESWIDLEDTVPEILEHQITPLASDIQYVREFKRVHTACDRLYPLYTTLYYSIILCRDAKEGDEYKRRTSFHLERCRATCDKIVNEIRQLSVASSIEAVSVLLLIPICNPAIAQGLTTGTNNICFDNIISLTELLHRLLLNALQTMDRLLEEYLTSAA
jgi:hypothetical protein